MKSAEEMTVPQPLTTEELHLVPEGQPQERMGPATSMAGRWYRRILGGYYGRMIPADASVLEVGCRNGELLRHLGSRDVTGVDASEEHVEQARRVVPHGTFHVQAGEELALDRTFDYIILSDTINQARDVQCLFERLQGVAHSRTRLLLNFHNTAWRPLLALATALGLRSP